MLRRVPRAILVLTVLAALAVGALLALQRPDAQASPDVTITVNNTADTNARDTVITLREAILLATGDDASLHFPGLTQTECGQISTAAYDPMLGCFSVDPPGATSHDTIVFKDSIFPAASPGTITLSGALPTLSTGNDTIDGSLRGVIVDGAGAFDCFLIDSDSNAIEGLAIGGCLHGVWIDGGQGNTIGGSSPGEGNWIYNSTSVGVLINAGAGGNSVKGNLIGIGPDGTTPAPNHIGVAIGSGGNTIGGSSEAERNVISGNTYSGVSLEGFGNTIDGNYIGTNAAGTASIPNGTGVRILSGAQNNTIGGSSAAERNVISGNGDAGVEISDGGTGNSVKGNYIGINASGTAAIPNGTGVLITTGAQNNTIGGSSAAERNIVSGNTTGVMMLGVGVNGNVVKRNYIGVNAAATALVPNDFGVRITAGAQNNTIGGTAADEGNLIAFNTSAGVRVSDGGSTGNTIRGNSIHSNGAEGIQLSEGGNAELAPPVITGFGSVIGTACANCTVDVYSDDEDEGRVYEGSTTADNGGDWTFDGSPQGPNVTATATDAAGNTSEFSAPVEAPEATPTPTPTPTATPGATPTPAGPTRTLQWGPGWNNATWSGSGGIAPSDAFACAAGKYAAAYRYVAGGLERFFPDRPDISNMTPLAQYDAFLILITEPVTCMMPVAAASGTSRTLQWGMGWNNAGWSGADATSPDRAFACSDGSYAAAYRFADAGLERYFPGRPDISNMAPLNKFDAFLILATAPVNCAMPVGP